MRFIILAALIGLSTAEVHAKSTSNDALASALKLYDSFDCAGDLIVSPVNYGWSLASWATLRAFRALPHLRVLRGRPEDPFRPFVALSREFAAPGGGPERAGLRFYYYRFVRKAHHHTQSNIYAKLALILDIHTHRIRKNLLARLEPNVRATLALTGGQADWVNRGRDYIVVASLWVDPKLIPREAYAETVREYLALESDVPRFPYTFTSTYH